MRKIRIIEHISLDGVIQAPGGPNEDPGYRHGGWSVAHADPEGGKATVADLGEAFDLLLGRLTYDIFSRYWPKASKSQMADGLNAATKYVATHRPKSLAWGPAEDLGADNVQGIRRIKEKSGPQLIVRGSSTLTPMLIEHGLADEVLLLVFPVPLGTGKRIFSEGTPPLELALVSTKAVPSGVIISTYRPIVSLRTAPTTMRASEPIPEIMGGPPALGVENDCLPRTRNRRQTERSPIFRQMESGERPVCPSFSV